MNLQGGLPFDAEIVIDQFDPRSAFAPVPPPRNIVRDVCRQNANRLRDEAKQDRIDGMETKAQRVHRCLAAFTNRYGYAPTPAELTRYMFERGEIPKDRVNLVAPRLSEGVNGKVQRGADGSKIRVGGGVYELLPLRTCRVNSDDAHPVGIRTAGSREPR